MPCGQKSTGTISDWYGSYTYDSANGDGYTTGDLVGGREGHINEVAGVCLKDFHRRKAAGELLPHTTWFKSDKTVYGRGVINQAYQANPPSTFWSTAVGDRWDPVVPNIDISVADLVVNQDDLDYYVQAAAADIYGQFHDTLTFIAEIRKIRTLWEGLATKLINLDIASLNLNWRYGWRTLKYDIESLQDAIHALDDDRFKIATSRKGGSHQDLAENQETILKSNGYWTVDTRLQREWSLRGAVAGRIKQPRFSFNVAVTAWETVPYSFVLDWVVNIGQWIQGMSFLLFATQYTASKGLYITGTRTLDASFTYTDTRYSGTWTCTGTATLSIKQRWPSTVPSLPQIKVRLDDWKILDIIALIYQKIPRKFR